MTDEQTSATEEKETQQAETEGGETPAESKPNDTKAMEAALRKANKEAEKLRLKLKEFEDKDKSEADKLVEARTIAEKERDALKREALQLRVGMAKKLPLEVAERLRGDTEEEMSADADRLAALLKPGAPSGSVDGGNTGKPPGTEKDMNALLREAVRGAQN